LFLDEIGELPLVMQAKLLRVLQDREFVRVGSTKIRKVDVRIISATNRDLEKEVREGRFRSDLFYRLRVAVVTIPALRERHADIVPLAKHFLDRYTNRYKRDLHFNPMVLDAFSDYQWPGNIREIENLIQSLVITNQNGTIQLSDLPSNMAGHMADTCREPATEDPALLSDELAFSDLHHELDSGDRSLKAIMADIERQILTYALKKHGSHTKVAQRFKVDRSTLFRKLRSER
jgi:transcriptional regulator with PAS, ATPase and Fis domain